MSHVTHLPLPRLILGVALQHTLQYTPQHSATHIATHIYTHSFLQLISGVDHMRDGRYHIPAMAAASWWRPMPAAARRCGLLRCPLPCASTPTLAQSLEARMCSPTFASRGRVLPPRRTTCTPGRNASPNPVRGWRSTGRPESTLSHDPPTAHRT